jgi:uncharacterized protein (TIGR00255 family)
MTGYGSVQTDLPTITINVEIKSLNSKFFEAYVRLPRVFADKEMEVRNVLTQRIERGKVSCSIEIIFKQEKPTAYINKALAAAYYQDLKEVAETLGIAQQPTDFLRHILTLPDVLMTETTPKYEQEWKAVQDAIQQALAAFEQFRLQEGKVIQNQMQIGSQKIAELLQSIINEDVRRLAEVRKRLQDKVKELMQTENFDQNRFEQELIYYIERMDITEEKVRLDNHLKYFEQTLQEKGANGKKLNFIAQEMGREINTIGSKANDAVIQRIVVEMKDELEKIKEQTANIL